MVMFTSWDDGWGWRVGKYMMGLVAGYFDLKDLYLKPALCC